MTNGLIQSHNGNKESDIIRHFFIAASCANRIASLMRFGGFFVLSDSMCYVTVIQSSLVGGVRCLV